MFQRFNNDIINGTKYDHWALTYNKNSFNIMYYIYYF